jgi:hypothetical protein
MKLIIKFNELISRTQLGSVLSFVEHIFSIFVLCSFAQNLHTSLDLMFIYCRSNPVFVKLVTPHRVELKIPFQFAISKDV